MVDHELINPSSYTVQRTVQFIFLKYTVLLLALISQIIFSYGYDIVTPDTFDSLWL